VSTSIAFLATYVTVLHRDAGSSWVCALTATALLAFVAWTLYLFRATSPTQGWERVGDFLRHRRAPTFGEGTRVLAVACTVVAAVPLLSSIMPSGLSTGSDPVLVVLGGLAFQAAAVFATFKALAIWRTHQAARHRRECQHSYVFRELAGVRLTMPAGHPPPRGHMVCSKCNDMYAVM
jgi:uncharacterized membrane protein